MEKWTTLLLDWYSRNKRPLPFRENPTPYGVWISEIMAQQTRIEAMLPYYSRFMDRMPSLQSLAVIDEEELMKLWQGLGYYSRARNLKKAALVCMEEYDGQLPRTAEELKKLPGIGEYTAGAIASIACGQKTAAIDGNVLRVFSRLYCIDGDVRSRENLALITRLVNEALPEAQECGSFNQALMDLGAMICTPKSADCEKCPLREFCKAKKQNRQNELPCKMVKKPRAITEKKAVVAVWKNPKTQAWEIRVHRRPAKGLLAGMMEFPESLPAEDNIEASLDLGEYTHVFTHREWHMKGLLVFVKQKTDDFVELGQLEHQLPLPSAFLPFYKRTKEILYGKYAHPYGGL